MRCKLAYRILKSDQGEVLTKDTITEENTILKRNQGVGNVSIKATPKLIIENCTMRQLTVRETL